MGVIKHFPGHGTVLEDSHLTLPIDRRPLSELEHSDLVPFRQAIAAGASAVLTDHILYPKIDDRYPASLSPSITTGLLRRSLRFHGLVITDALEMGAISHRWTLEQAAVRAVAAGADMVIIWKSVAQVPSVVAALRNAIMTGRIPVDRARDALAHIRAAYALLSTLRSAAGCGPG